MKILIINFNLKNLGVDDFKAQAHIDAMDFRGVEGLISKYFIGDENDNDVLQYPNNWDLINDDTIIESHIPSNNVLGNSHSSEV